MQQCYEGSYYFPVLNKKHFPTCDAFNKPKCVSQTRRSIYIYLSQVTICLHTKQKLLCFC